MKSATSPEVEAERVMLRATRSTIWPVLETLAMLGWMYRDPQLNPNLQRSGTYGN